MLPHAILLLLGSLAIADAVDPPCHKNYVKPKIFPPGFGITPDSPPDLVKTMQCTPPTTYLEYDGKLYEKMRCLPAGWQGVVGGAEKAIIPIKPPKEDIKIDCVAKACHQSLISGFNNAEMTYGDDKKLTCKAPEDEIEYTDAGKKRSDSLTCDTTSHLWKGAVDAPTTVGDEDLIAVACVKKGCHPLLVTVDATTAQRTTNQITCTVPTDEIQIGIESGKYTDLRCDKENGWQDGGVGVKVKPADDQFDVKCVAKAPPTCTFPSPPSGMKFESSTKTLTCTTDRHALQKDATGPFHASMKCYETTGWTSADGTFNVNTPTILPADVTCEEYCAWTEQGVEVEATTNDPNTFTVKCSIASEGVLHYQNAPVNGADLTCSMNGGWKKENGAETATGKLECKKACDNFNPALETAKVGSPTAGVFKCIDPLLKGIKLGGKFVYSNLYCEAATGWTDVYKKTPLAGAFDQVEITCDPFPCKGVGVSTCGAFDISKLENRAEYLCEGAGSPLTDDPNFQKCDTKQKLFNVETNQFYDKPLKCQKDENWHLVDDPENAVIPSTQIGTLICVRKLCNTCDPLVLLTGVGEPVTAITEGTADDCHKATCPGDLWHIQRTVNGQQKTEQYAGDVTCSSDKATNTDAKKSWLIDGLTLIEAASCFTQAEKNSLSGVKCTEAAVLSTTCLNWPGPCEEPHQLGTTLDDDNDVKCTATETKMFYMQKGEHGFEEGGEKIKCDKTKGKWIITKNGGDTVELKRHGTVICAVANPQPITTTEAPTTTTPLVKACDLCPNITSVLKTCETCSTKSTDLQLSNNDDNDVCTAKPYGDKKIETEKAGKVKELQCKKADKTWLTTDGKEPGKFAAYQDGPPKDDGNLPYIVAGLVGGVLFLLIVFVVIFKVFVAKKKPEDKDEETRRKMLEEGKKKKKQKAGDNDEILDDVVVDAPSELKL